MIELHAKGVLLHIRVKTRAKSRSISITGHPPVCLVSVKAAPIRGRANREVIRLIAEHLNVSTTRVILVAGVMSPRKSLLIMDMVPADVLAALKQ
ncbi:MAG: DUF167 domain-containing protein [Promethearchaeota archaeon]